MTWPHQIPLLHQWSAIFIATVFVFFASWLVKRRSEIPEGSTIFLFLWGLTIASVSIGGFLAHLLHKDTEQLAWKIDFYLLYGYAALMAFLSAPRLIAELRDMAQMMVVMWRKPNIARLVTHRRVKRLWKACCYYERIIVRKYCFKTDWMKDWKLSEQAVEAVASLGELVGLFEYLSKNKCNDDLMRIIRQFQNSSILNASEALFWVARRCPGKLRSAALTALAQRPDSELVRWCDWVELAEVVQSQQEDDAMHALDICERVEAEDAFGIMVASRQSPWHRVRMRGAIALAEHGDRSAIPLLVETLRDRTDIAKILKALSHIPDRSVLEPITALLPTLTQAETLLALDLLEQIGDPSAAEAVAPLLSNLGCAPVAARVLGQLNWKPTTEAEAISLRIVNKDWSGCADLGPVAVDALVAALRSQQTDRIGILKALGRIGDSRAVVHVCSLITDETAKEEIRAALVTLDALGEEGRAAIVEIAEKCSIAIRQEALTVLGAQSLEAEAEVRRRLLASEGPLSSESLNEVIALGRAAVPLLCDACRNASEPRIASLLSTVVRLDGALALAETLKSKASFIPFLIGTIRSGSDEMAAAAVEVLKHMPMDLLSKHLLNHLQHPLRMPAGPMTELLTLVAPRVANSLASLLQASQDKEVLTIATEVLAKAGDDRILPLIVSAIKKNRLSLSEVKSALLRLDNDALERLIEFLPSTDLEIVQIFHEISQRRAIKPHVQH